MLLLFDIDGVLNQADYFTIPYSEDFGVEISVFEEFFNSKFNDILIGKSKIEEVLPSYFESWKWKRTVDEFLNY